jgi:methylamine dehydrogenase heavy chain
VYIPDIAFNHLVDGLVRIVDGDSLRYLGTVSMGYMGFFNTSRDNSRLFTAATYYERLNRGNRTDTVTVYDAHSLQLLREVVIPTKHAQEVPYPAFLVPAWSGPWLYTQNATPASSVTVIDVDAGKLVGEVQTAGCYGIYPSDKLATRFTSLCGDGSALTVTLDDKGGEVERKRSAKLFDPDAGALFTAVAEDGDHVVFVSFQGLIHEVDVSGDTATEAKSPWSILNADLENEGWRPGGDQVVALHIAGRQLFLTMHRHGKEGTHKSTADEIWQVDMNSHRVVKRILGAHALSIAVTQGDHPKLFAISGEDGSLSRYDVDNGLAYTGEFAKPLAETAATLSVR